LNTWMCCCLLDTFPTVRCFGKTVSGKQSVEAAFADLLEYWLINKYFNKFIYVVRSKSNPIILHQ
jgi:hypothetical protein